MGDEIIKVLNDLSDKLGVAINWSSETILPEISTLMEKYVEYKAYTSIMWIILGGVIILLGIGSIILAFTDFAYEVDCEPRFFVVGALVIIMGAIIVLANVDTIILCNTFPEKLMFNLVQNALKS